MNRKKITSLAIIVLVFAAIGGATMAWFTDEVTLNNTFSAGTLSIDGSDHWEDYLEDEEWENVNPGDCKDKIITITNDGSKNALLRFIWEGVWTGVVDENGAPMDGDPELVTVTAPDGWYLHTDGYWYYEDGPLAPDSEFEFTLTVCINGPGTGNGYQGATFTLGFDFEAIQASNNASGDVWLVDSLYAPTDPESAENWNSFDFQ